MAGPDPAIHSDTDWMGGSNPPMEM